MIEDEMEEALNDQINDELYSSYIYLAMAADFADKGLDGMEGWMREQAQEEVTHAMKIFDYVEERGGRVCLDEIEKPNGEWESALKAFKDAYEHEQYITSRINELMDLAEEKKDRATMNMLQWFVEEQVEEESSVEEIVDKLEMVGDDPTGLMRLDENLGQRSSNIGLDTVEEGSEEENA